MIYTIFYRPIEEVFYIRRKDYILLVVKIDGVSHLLNNNTSSGLWDTGGGNSIVASIVIQHPITSQYLEDLYELIS